MPVMCGVAMDVPEMVPCQGSHWVSAGPPSPPTQMACVALGWKQVEVMVSPGAAMSG